ncbi:hypothetical protein PBY51_003317 [Eleginops maclovinus]|uniref:Uncharacterized protein n=1 Tax=Eleginops maclovinus TaxID=56733 RepID=A0AAN7XEK2_ELEMC|nr:hypothetical protein PBY51_003317 [Eleginops maclovinus]
MAPQCCSPGAAAVSGSLGALSRLSLCSLPAAEQQRLRFAGLRLRSIRHADCSLLHSVKEAAQIGVKTRLRFGSDSNPGSMSCPGLQKLTCILQL